jgi:putative membrane protein
MGRARLLFLTDEVKAALREAIVAVESRTSAEVVIAVRARSATYRHVEMIAGGLVCFAALATMLFVDHEFSLLSILIDPFIAAIIGGLLATQIDPLHRLLTPRATRMDRVRVAAQSVFYENRVRLTQERTGILVYVSLLERAALVVPDVGVEGAVDEARWDRAVRDIDAAVAGGGLALAAAIERLGDVLEPALPRSEFDINELPDEVDA